MSLSVNFALLLTLAGQCAPDVHPETLAAIVRTESGGNPLTIHINGGPQPPSKPTSKAEILALARRALAAGHSVDLGLMQINSANLGWLEMSLEDTLDPCQNLAAGARILEENYQRALRKFEKGQPALQVALSAYNTGDQQAGFRNGYVQKVLKNAKYQVPALSAAQADPEPAREWDVYGGAEGMEADWNAFSGVLR